jgi:sterol desaturase/sphingolipid hydroxylase (fatty acid hydroxylase superfamily)
MFSAANIAVLLLIATLGHAMAFFWYAALKRQWPICRRTIYALPINERQIRREFVNSLHTPVHAVILAGFLALGFFQNTSWLSFFVSLVATAILAEIWHYASHRAFHLGALHWIHAEHHKSHLNTPFTAISFAFSEKLIFDLGLLAPLALADSLVGVNFFGIAGWYVGYLVINSFAHANFEMRPKNYNRLLGKVLTTTTYHSLHHSRYTGNYGLGTRFLDRLCGTEWEDYERLYERVCSDRPLNRLREKVEPSDAPVLSGAKAE